MKIPIAPSRVTVQSLRFVTLLAQSDGVQEMMKLLHFCIEGRTLLVSQTNKGLYT